MAPGFLHEFMVEERKAEQKTLGRYGENLEVFLPRWPPSLLWVWHVAPRAICAILAGRFHGVEQVTVMNLADAALGRLIVAVALRAQAEQAWPKRLGKFIT